jgi:arabinose-5-phosphate isomerase
MRPDLMELRVEDIQTRNPKVIERDSLASEALEVLNSVKITTLIVTEASKPVGIIHLHDLLRAGVA